MSDIEQKHADEVRYALRLKAEGKTRPGAKCKGCAEWHTRLLCCVDGVRTWAATCSPTCREGMEVRLALASKVDGRDRLAAWIAETRKNGDWNKFVIIPEDDDESTT